MLNLSPIRTPGQALATLTALEIVLVIDNIVFRGYLYFAVAFSEVVEALNQLVARRCAKLKRRCESAERKEFPPQSTF